VEIRGDRVVRRPDVGEDPELLARDRLLASYRVRPVLRKLRNILMGLGTSLALVILTVGLLPPAYTPKPDLPRALPLEEIDG